MNSGCVVDRRSYGGGNAGQTDLADPTRTKFVDFLVGKVEEVLSLP